MSEAELSAIQNPMDSRLLTNWLEELIVKVLYGEFVLTPSGTIDMLRYFSNLYQLLLRGEFIGRYLFDLGQSLYEGGRPKIGKLLMYRGINTTDHVTEGVVSSEVIALRLTFDFPLIPHTLAEVVETYLNITSFLSVSDYVRMDMENSLDVYWPLPLLGWSALPMTSVLRELLWRFTVNQTNKWFDGIVPVDIHPNEFFFHSQLSSAASTASAASSGASAAAPSTTTHNKHKQGQQGTQQEFLGRYDDLKAQGASIVSPKRTASANVAGTAAQPFRILKGHKIAIGLLGGHMNSHAVGQSILANILTVLDQCHHTAAGTAAGAGGASNAWRTHMSFTLISLPLINDGITKRIANKVDRVINLPADPKQAQLLLDTLTLDIVIFPDWQPFPDTQTVFLRTLRIAPVQLCLFVRGTSCATDEIDYYLLPKELEAAYLTAVPAASVDAKVIRGNLSRPMRPPWREVYSEQVVLLDWPLLTENMLVNTITMTHQDETIKQHRTSTQHEHDQTLSFASTENEKISFDQPVAVLSFDPSYIHPLMDELLFKLMRTLPALQIVLVLPASFHPHAVDVKHQISWARKLARRLWAK